MSARLTAGGRLERLLAIVPYVAAHDGPLISEVAERFDYPEHNLLADLEQTVWMVGVYPFTPDSLIEVVLEDGRVWIHYADYFERALRLTPVEALSLISASSSVLAVPGADPDGPLARGLRKLSNSLGIDGEDTAVEVELGAAEPETLRLMQDAVANHQQLEIDYYTYGRDQVSTRLVDPLRVSSDAGNWYLLAYCHRATGQRVFRLDRIRSAHPTGELFDPPATTPELAVFQPDRDDPRVTLRVTADAAWVASFYPVDSVEELDDHELRITLAVSAVPWLERLLLRLGGSAVVEDHDERIPDTLVCDAAKRVLERYG